MVHVRAEDRSIGDSMLARLGLAPSAQRPRTRAPRGWLVSVIRWADASISRADGIVDFTDDPDCILRIAVRRTDAPLRLSHDVIPAGATFLDLHFHNDHLLRDDAHGLKWGARFRNRLVVSLAELAEALEREPRLADVRAVRGRLASPLGRRHAELARFAARFGFEPVPDDHRHWTDTLHDLGENIWLVMLGLAFGARAHEHRALLRWRGDMWLSRERLIGRFGRGRLEAARQGQGEGQAAHARSA